jgi:hypothetical protein
MNSFAQHGIEHLSASSLNLWAAQPALWIMERLLGRRTPPGIAAARGKAVELGVHLGLSNPRLSIEDCIEGAEREFIRETALSADPRREDERKKLAGWVRGALAELRQYGTPDGYQEKIEIRLDDVPVPARRLYRLALRSGHGLIVDLKTTERLPSADPRCPWPPGRHLCQGARQLRHALRLRQARAGKTDRPSPSSSTRCRPTTSAGISPRCADRAFVSAGSLRCQATARARRPARPDFDSFLVEPTRPPAPTGAALRFLKRQPPSTRGERHASQHRRFWFQQALRQVQCQGRQVVRPRPRRRRCRDRAGRRSSIDFANIAPAGCLFPRGPAPEKVIDPSLDRPRPSPGEGFKRGFVVAMVQRRNSSAAPPSSRAPPSTWATPSARSTSLRGAAGPPSRPAAGDRLHRLGADEGQVRHQLQAEAGDRANGSTGRRSCPTRARSMPPTSGRARRRPPPNP